MAKRVVQEHHISHDPPVTVKIYQGEHWVLTQLQRRKWISKGLITALEIFIALNKNKAKDLEEKYE